MEAPGQKKPGLQEKASGKPSTHVNPGGQTPQSEAREAPTLPEKVPFAQGVGTADAGGQKKPRGHKSPLGMIPTGFGVATPW